MKNIAFLMAKLNVSNYTNDDMCSILKTECEIQGKEKQMIRCMEEFAELIEVLTEYKIHGRMDHINLMEEMVDCKLCISVLRILFNVYENDLNHYFYDYEEPSLVDNCILNLATASIKISKCLRERKNAEMAIIGLINDINETLENLREHFDIDMDDINKITLLKIDRSRVRNDETINNVKTFNDPVLEEDND